MSLTQLALVAAGGGLGAAARFALASAIGRAHDSGFPFGTLAVNLLGCLLIGAFVEASALLWSPSPGLRLFLVTGVLGGFTTFSAFALESWAEIDVAPARAALYVLLSVAGGLGAFWLGKAILRGWA